jgi:hypothetical protein
MVELDMDKEHILNEIHRLAKDGKAPGQKLIASQLDIKPHHWGKYWARWGDALIEAGYATNNWQTELDGNEILYKLALLTRQLGKIPTKGDIGVEAANGSGFPSSNAIRRRWSKAELIPALQAYCDASPEFSDVAGIVTAAPRPVQQQSTERREASAVGRDRYVYLLKSRNNYKIGFAKDPLSRAAGIHGMTPDGLIIEHFIRTDDPHGIEEYWHKRFADKRGNGEWFALSAPDVAVFKRRTFM